MEINDYLSNLPMLHSFDGGMSWNTGGFDEHQLEALCSLLKSKLPVAPRLLETGAGNSTITMLFLSPSKLITICPDAEVVKRVKAYCATNDIPIGPLEVRDDCSEWVLPELAATARNSDPILDFALIDGCHGWPTAFVDLEYIHSMLRVGAFLMIDDIQLHSVKEMAKLVLEQPDFYETVLDLGKALVLKKITSNRSFGEWSGQPYIVRKTNLYARPFSTDDEDIGGGREEARRLTQLEKENALLKKLLAEAELEKAMLKDLAEGNF
jgi:predicted O-methyltransferase YrrM